MASSDSLRENQGFGERALRSDRETDEYWSSISVEEPISDDLKVRIKADLRKVWHFRRDAQFRTLTRRRWATTDDYRIVLDDLTGRLSSRTLKFLCNKPTAFYWLQSAQQINGFGARTLTPSIIFATVFEEWLRQHDTEPNIEYGHFFANPVIVTPTGPSTVSGIIDAHLSLCKQASCLINQAKDRTDDGIKPHPSDLQYYSLLPPYHAIIVILDCLDMSEIDSNYDSDGFISLRKLARSQTVLIVRTGAEEGLSAPISLESLKSQSLPLERSDVITEDVDVVRVSVAVAVQFIVGLEKTEELAMTKSDDILPPETRLCPLAPKGFEKNRQVRYSPEAWVDAQMAAAERHGYDNIDETWESIRRIQAALVGEGFFELEPLPFGRWWR